MDFTDYQIESRKTWINNRNSDIRAVLGLVGEAGEVAEKYKKFLRGDSELNKDDIKLELGDVLYYIARICDDNNIKLLDVAISNIDKLKDRQKRNVLKGNGDSR